MICLTLLALDNLQSLSKYYLARASVNTREVLQSLCVDTSEGSKLHALHVDDFAAFFKFEIERV